MGLVDACGVVRVWVVLFVRGGGAVCLNIGDAPKMCLVFPLAFFFETITPRKSHTRSLSGLRAGFSTAKGACGLGCRFLAG